VALTGLVDYEPSYAARALGRMLQSLDFGLRSGDRVLLKPNLVSSRRGVLPCSEPALVAALCRFLQELGARVTVADSPAFGSAGGVARSVGLAAALEPLGLRVENPGRPVKTNLPSGGAVGVSREALEQDLIVNVPRLKAHGQMRVSACVKNLFGCVPGMRKALYHYRFGDRGARFSEMLLTVMHSLPPVLSVLDGVRAMHVTGPIGGEALDLGFLAASMNPVACDTAAYTILGLEATQVPLWREAQRQGLRGARKEELVFPLDPPGAFDAQGFIVPEKLDPETFDPFRLLRGGVKRFLARI
jgi:uncharacterized protein (DUF362 family)